MKKRKKAEKIKKNQQEEVFQGKFGALLSFSIFFTGIISLMGIAYGVMGIRGKIWETPDKMTNYWNNLLFFLIIICCFVMLIKMAIDEKPFSSALSKGIHLIGILLLGAAFLFPHLDGFQSSGFQLLAIGEKYYIEGRYFMEGLLFLLFARILKYGLEYQKEIETLL